MKSNIDKEEVLDLSRSHFQAGKLAQFFSDIIIKKGPIKLLLNDCTFEPGSERDFTLLKDNTNITILEFKNPVFLSENGEGLLESLANLGENRTLKEITIRNWDQPSLGQFLYYATRLKQLETLNIKSLKLDMSIALSLEPILQANICSSKPINIHCHFAHLRESDVKEINDNKKIFPNITRLIKFVRDLKGNENTETSRADEKKQISQLVNSGVIHPAEILKTDMNEVNLVATPEQIQAKAFPITDRSKDVIKYCLPRVSSTDFEALKSDMEDELRKGIRIIDFSGSYFNKTQFAEIQAIIQRNNNEQNPIQLILENCSFESGIDSQHASDELLKMPEHDQHW